MKVFGGTALALMFLAHTTFALDLCQISWSRPTRAWQLIVGGQPVQNFYGFEAAVQARNAAVQSARCRLAPASPCSIVKVSPFGYRPYYQIVYGTGSAEAMKSTQDFLIRNHAENQLSELISSGVCDGPWATAKDGD